MPDKSPVDQPTRRKGSAPKAPSQDYSSLPQKPIKLKDEVTLPPALKREAGKQTAPKAAIPKPKKRRNKPSVRKSPSVLDGLSVEARELVSQAAERTGMDPLAWLEQVIRNSPMSNRPEHATDSSELMQMLHRIDQRLEKLEDQRGFWSRFWDQFMNLQNRR